MSAEAGGGERRFVDSNLFVYAHDKSAGRKREVARDRYSSLTLLAPLRVGGSVIAGLSVQMVPNDKGVGTCL